MKTLSILLVGYVGLGGSIALVKENEEKLSKHFSKYFMHLCKKMDLYLVKPNLLYGEKCESAPFYGEVIELGEMNIYNSLWSALWNLCELNPFKREQMGIDVDVSKIPIRQETVEICQFFCLNPYKISSRGAYLILTTEPDKVIAHLKKGEIKVTLIGVITDKKERIIRRADDIRYLPRAPADERIGEANRRRLTEE